MPKSRLRKGHKSAIAIRNKKNSDQKAMMEKAKRQFIMDLIKKEQERGLYDNNLTIDPLIEGPQIDTLEGPSI